jgi:hypothetical protein
MAALKNIHRNANRERAAKELAESPNSIANGNGRDHELLRALKPADYDALFFDGESEARRVARTSVIIRLYLHVPGPVLCLNMSAYLTLCTSIVSLCEVSVLLFTL